MSDMTKEALLVEVESLKASLAASKGELEALKSDVEKFTLERRRDRVLEVALRLMPLHPNDGLKFEDFVADAVMLIAEVERQVTL